MNERKKVNMTKNFRQYDDNTIECKLGMQVGGASH